MFKKLKNIFSPIVALMAAFTLVGCSPKPYDYTAFKASHPRSILVLPPLNESNDVNAPNSILSTLTKPLAEGGYYVVPVSAMNETFKQNGFTLANDIQNIPIEKLQKIFGADAALYVSIKRYASTYGVIYRTDVVALSARLVDLRTGTTLWDGTARAVVAEGSISPLHLMVHQIMASMTDRTHKMAYIAADQLLNPYSKLQFNKILPGPYRSATVQ